MYINKWDQKDFKEFQKQFSKLFKVYNAKKLSKIDSNKKKIKIGFLSPDYYKNHSITYFIEDLIKGLKHTKFESYGLSLLKSHEHDETTEKLISLFNNWIVLGEKTDQEIIDIIQESKIDILIDLNGMWHNNRLSIFNTRICPLQISWLGFNNSSGLKEVDFILADVNTVKEEEKYYGPKIYKLPKIWNSHCGFEYERVFNELPFMTKCIVETLRLWPALANGTYRELEYDETIKGKDGSPVNVKKGTYCQIINWTRHRSEELWGESANEFNPHRDFKDSEIWC